MNRTPPDRLLRALAGRLHDEDVSIRTKMLEAAAKLDDVIAMGRGDPDLHTPAHIVEAAKRAIDANEHHYFRGALFGDDSDAYMRIGYLQPMARIEEAAARIERFVTGLRGSA